MSYNAYGLLPYLSPPTSSPSPFEYCFESPPVPTPVSNSQQSQLKLDNVWCEGDFTLASALEGRAEVQTLFRVHATELRSLSPRSMKLEEKPSVIRWFLNAAIHRSDPKPSTMALATFADVLKLARDLECDALLARLLSHLGDYAKIKSTDPFHLFSVACRFERWQVCALAIPLYRPGNKWYRDKHLALGCKLGEYLLNPKALPYHLWMEIPKKCMWALLRSCEDRKSWEERGKRFLELMKLIETREVVYPYITELEEDDAGE
ncbi:hypothetical protein JCM24511_00627 [Saitozyma sp. JCM 24511]|nr:hypothetical protein JCM24511_00627 [Saitozyma sp. JCM 24511]